MSSPADPGRGPASGAGRGDTPQNIATAIAEVSERATDLVHEEIELAKAELAEKTVELMRGAVIGAAAGIFIVMAVILGLVGFAWLLYWALPVGTLEYFWGFFAMAAILLVIAAVAGLLAARIVKRGSPPVPTMAIDEARKIRDTVSAGAEGNGVAGPSSAVRVAGPGSGAGQAGPVGPAGPAGPAGGQVS